MKIVIPGGNGHVGYMLAQAFQRDGHEVVVLSRQPVPTAWRTVAWDGRSLGKWAEEIEGADVVINLAGRSVNCRYNARNRREIMNSRVNSTHVIGEAIARATNPPRLWLQASTATTYAHQYDAPNDEITGILGGAEPNVPDTWRFSNEVAQAWEQAVQDVGPMPRTRTILLRSAIVMSPDRGGAFDMLLRLVRLRLSGRNGDGRQYVSWIHEVDFVCAIYWLIENDSLSGPVNLASPGPLPNVDFMRILRQAWGARFGLPATNWMLEIGAFFLRTETELILKSRFVVPTRLVQSGFAFQFPHWADAANDLCAQVRATL